MGREEKPSQCAGPLREGERAIYNYSEGRRRRKAPAATASVSTAPRAALWKIDLRGAAGACASAFFSSILSLALALSRDSRRGLATRPLAAGSPRRNLL